MTRRFLIAALAALAAAPWIPRRADASERFVVRDGWVLRERDL